MSDKLNIHQRMLAAMKECGYVQKDGYNSFSKYKYVTHDAVVEHVRAALVNNGIIAITNMDEVEWPEGAQTNGGKHSNLCRVKMTTHFINADDPKDTISVSIWGEAADTGDKSIFKAISGAKKYIFTNTFMLATGEDPEQDSPAYTQPASKKGKEKPASDDSEIAEARAAFSDARAKLGLSAAEMTKLFPGDIKTAAPDDIMAFLSELDLRYIYKGKAQQAIAQYGACGEALDELAAQCGCVDLAKNWASVPSASILNFIEGVDARWDLPFDTSLKTKEQK